MKKITKLSMAACLLLTSSVFADTLEEAFSNSKIKGEIKAQYFDKQSPADGKNDNIFVTGGNINIVTGSFYGLHAGVTFQASHVVDRSIEGTNDFASTMDASGAVMSESYLAYTLNNTTLKVGRQYISTPLVAGSGSRMIKESFEGVTLTNTDLTDTTVVAGYVSKFQGRTDGSEKPGEFDKYEDGAYTLYVKNNSIENLTLQGQYLDVDGATANTDKNALYVDGVYDAKIAKVSLQVIDSKNESNAKSDGRLYGAKISGNIGMVNLTGLYTSTTDDGDVFVGAGNGADSGYTALPVHGGSVTYKANTDTMVAVAATQLAGATVVAYIGQVKSPDDNNLGGSDKIDAYGGFVQYAFNKNFSTKVMYENASFSDTLKDSNALRVYTSYKF
ncbi:OprD family outer membrane porin [Arcobacter sp. YIC-464]|uniref:OprD family outer membrane porin n=1 Tax=Arcobacter sp. YIC-464 TaxID=3376631 RepID=UPI003C141BA7